MRMNGPALLVLAMLAAGAHAADGDSDSEPRSYPLLGASAAPKVDVAWDRVYDSEGLASILSRLARAYPGLTRLTSIGKSVEGRDIWCLEVTNRAAGDPDRKPAMYIDGNIHGNEVQGGEAVAYTAWYLCQQHGRLPRITALLDRCTFYLVPTINPDGRDSWLREAHTAHSSRTGRRPVDNDRDGMLDEDGPQDLDGDGQITSMRRKDPHGRWKPDPDHPEYRMVRVEPDEAGGWEMLGQEGLDDDGDGRVNEDGPGGYDPNRDWAWDWQPSYIQGGARDYPVSLPETRAVVSFVLAHPNIAAMQSYHNAGGMILRSPGREGGEVQAEDDRVLAFIAGRGEKMLPFYRSMVIWKDLYTVWGGEVDWFYGGRGILAFTNELWSQSNLLRAKDEPSTKEEAAFLKHVLLEDGVVPWKEFDHPTYGKIEIGGTRKEWGRVPPSFLLEEECHRNMAFTLFHADMMPNLSIDDVSVSRVADGLYKVRVTIANDRPMPSRSGQDVAHRINAPDIVSLSGPSVKVLAAGRVIDRDFNDVEAVPRRPERVELPSVPGMGAERVQFVVSGAGRFTVTVDSAKGGVLKRAGELK